MSIPGPPSFDDFFNNQQAQRQRSTDVQYDNKQSFPYAGRLQPDQPLMEEPQSLSRRDSNGSMANHRRAGSVSSITNSRLKAVRGGSGSSTDQLRQDSFPFDPEQSSTIISTAARVQEPIRNTGEIIFGGPSSSPQYQQVEQPQQYHYNASAAQPPYNPQQWTGGDHYNAGNVFGQNTSFSINTPQTDGTGETYLVDQPSPFPSNTYQGPQQAVTWGNDFVNQENGNGNGTDAYGWNGETGNNVDGMFHGEDPLVELERIISNPASGSHHPSREGTPLHSDARPVPPQDHAELVYTPTFESTISSRSTSPYPQAAMSTMFSPPLTASYRRSPSPHSPSLFNKPQSPPALIIPSQQHSPSPVLPPIITSTENPSGGQGQAAQGAGLGGISGGLFPPSNPALEGLTGMAGISPIAPNADGPMIYIQPSTPISGLKDGRGVFDFKQATLDQQAKLMQQRQHLQQQQQQQQQSQSNDPFNAVDRGIPQHPSLEGLDQMTQQESRQQLFNAWNGTTWQGLRPSINFRPRAKSDSQVATFDRQAFANPVSAPMAPNFSIPQGLTEDELRAAIDHWRSGAGFVQPSDGVASGPTVDPRSLPGAEEQMMAQLRLSQQFANMQSGRNISIDTDVPKNGSGQISPTSLAFYAELGINPPTASGTTYSAPFFQTAFQPLPEQAWPQTAGPLTGFLAPEQTVRRRSIAEGTHHAVGAGTPGYGIEFNKGSPFGTLDPGRVRGVTGHRRAAKSEDIGRGGTGWGMGGGGSTADFLDSITANDGTLLPPSRGRSHSRRSSASSVRSVSPALSVSSQGSSYGSPRMDMPEGAQVPPLHEAGPSAPKVKKRVAKMKVTSMATEVASASRRTNDGAFQCPVPGCGSTFTRHFNLKGHLRSHNDERPYKCLYDGCPKSTVGFARQHDCKRHMLLHEGLRPFECEGCGKKFARLDALTRHHKSEQGQECAISHPLPTNPDGTPMSESQYKAYRVAQHNLQQQRQHIGMPFGEGGPGRIKRESSFQSYLSGDDRSGAEDELGTGSGMEDYDVF